MKRKSAALLLCCVCLCGCGIQQPETPPAAGHIQITASETQTQPAGKLNEWQIKLLESKGMPTGYDQLSPTQQNTIDRAWVMISHLNEKYGEEFVYVKYIPREQFQSETLVAYPRSTGSGDGKYLVTVKTKDDGFTDDYSDFSVTDLVEKLTNDFLKEHFGDSYDLSLSPLVCDITKNEIVNGKFQWKYGATTGICLFEKDCGIDSVEAFAAQYAKFLYEHELSGSHRIQITKQFPKTKEDWEKTMTNINKLSTGFYWFAGNSSSHAPDCYSTAYVKYDLEKEGALAEMFHISQSYPVQDFFQKSCNM